MKLQIHTTSKNVNVITTLGHKLQQYTLACTEYSIAVFFSLLAAVLYLQHSLWEVSVEESNHLLHIGAALGPHCDHVAIPKPVTSS